MQPASQRLVLSSSSFMDLPEGASFRWVEIEARSLAEHRAHLQQLEEAMRRDALSPALAGGPARTELEVSLCSSLLRQWSAITAERLCEGAGACLEVTPLAPPQKPKPTVGEWLQLHERGVVDAAELRRHLGLEAS
jgi:hypothetical protein